MPLYHAVFEGKRLEANVHAELTRCTAYGDACCAYRYERPTVEHRYDGEPISEDRARILWSRHLRSVRATDEASAGVMDRIFPPDA